MKNRILSLLIAVLVAASPTTTVTAQVESSLGVCTTRFGTPAANEYEVDITFSGIGVYDRHETDGFVDLIMPDLSSGKPATVDPRDSGNILRDVIPRHIAYVLARVEAYKPTIDAGTTLTGAEYEPSCYKYFTLDHVVVTAVDGLPDRRKNMPVCDTDKTDGDSCPTADTKGSMHWVPKLRSAAGEAPTDTAHARTPKNADFFPDPSHPEAVALNRDKVAARIRIDRGYLETSVTNGTIWSFRIHEGDSAETGTPQAIAQEVHWHLRAQGTPFVLHLSSGTDLKFAPPSAGERLKIFIANSPSWETGPIHGASAESKDEHFSVYYDFIKGFPIEDSTIPIASDACDGDAAMGTVTLLPCANCPTDPNCTLEARAAFTLLLEHKLRRGAKVVTLQHDHGGALGGLPSGLNCGQTQWP